LLPEKRTVIGAGLLAGLFVVCAAGVADAQDGPRTEVAPTASAVPKGQAIPVPIFEKELPSALPAPDAWQGPFGGTLSTTLSFTTDYSFRGISQTERQVAGQAAFGYETAPVSEKIPLSAYVGAWGSNVYYAATTTATVEVDLLAGFRLKALDEKLSFDLGFARVNYLGVAPERNFNYSEFNLTAGYDFGFAQLSAAVHYSPNFFADSGVAWYKWGQVAVPLTFIKFNENVAFKLFGAVGNQYVERYARYDIPSNNYWDWQIGLTATVYTINLTIAYVDTNIDVAGCANSMNCQSRAIFTISKTF
jgi:uncharacterized protein (TIGR02001 family)